MLQLAVAAVQALAGLQQADALPGALVDGGVHVLHGGAVAQAGALDGAGALALDVGQVILHGGQARDQRLLALLEQARLGAGVLRLGQKRARAAEGTLRCREARGVQLGTDARSQLLLRGQARLELLLVLQHDPLGILLAGFLRLGGLVGAEQHDQRGGGQHEGEHHQAYAERGERQAGDLAAVHEQRHAGCHEHEGQRDGQPHLHAALATAPLVHLMHVLGFEQRLVGSGGRCAVLLGQVHAVRAFRLLLGQRVDAVAQGALVGGAQGHERRVQGLLAHTMLGGQGGLVLAQGVALAAQLVALGVQLLQAGRQAPR